MFYEGNTLFEVKAYRDTEKEVFDFGDGPMIIEGVYGSEDAYYEMCIQEREDRLHEKQIKYKENVDNGNICIKKIRIGKYQKRLESIEKEKENMERLREKNWWVVSDMGTHLKRNYLSGRSTFLKKEANTKVRNHMRTIDNGSQYKKIYEIGYNLY